jgi:hypothetical protein
MPAFNLKTAIIVVCALALAVLTINFAVYLSIDPGSLSAQIPIKVIVTSPRGE